MSDDFSHLAAVWPFPTAVRFGVGRVAELAKVCTQLGMTRPLLVTDRGLATTALVAGVVAIMADGKLSPDLFGEVKSNPTAANVAAGAAAYGAGGHDGIIALGGGSAMDAAKGIALQLAQADDVMDYAVGGPRYKEISTDGLPPVVALPTTSGTGSEVGRAAVVSDEAAQVKRILYHTDLMPRVVICDPALVVGLPADLTAWTGLDAAVHCLEAYCATMYNPMCDGIAAEGLRLIHRWLPSAVKDGTDLEARAHMMAAAAMGAVAFTKGLGAVHAISHAIGARYDSHHGLTNAVILPYVLVHNRPAIADRLGPLAAYMGLADPGFTGFLDWTLEVRDAFEVPHQADALGVTDDVLDSLAEVAAADVTARENPLPVDAPALGGIISRALSGSLE